MTSEALAELAKAAHSVRYRLLIDPTADSVDIDQDELRVLLADYDRLLAMQERARVATTGRARQDSDYAQGWTECANVIYGEQP